MEQAQNNHANLQRPDNPPWPHRIDLRKISAFVEQQEHEIRRIRELVEEAHYMLQEIADELNVIILPKRK